MRLSGPLSFRQRLFFLCRWTSRRPAVFSGQVDVFPSERRDVGVLFADAPPGLVHQEPVVDVGDLVDGGGDGPREHARLQREAQLVAGTPPGPDVLQVVIAQGVVAPPVHLTWRKGKRGRSLPACQNGSPCHALSLDVCKT